MAGVGGARSAPLPNRRGKARRYCPGSLPASARIRGVATGAITPPSTAGLDHPAGGPLRRRCFPAPRRAVPSLTNREPGSWRSAAAGRNRVPIGRRERPMRRGRLSSLNRRRPRATRGGHTHDWATGERSTSILRPRSDGKADGETTPPIRFIAADGISTEPPTEHGSLAAGMSSRVPRQWEAGSPRPGNPTSRCRWNMWMACFVTTAFHPLTSFSTTSRHMGRGRWSRHEMNPRQRHRRNRLYWSMPRTSTKHGLRAGEPSSIACSVSSRRTPSSWHRPPRTAGSTDSVSSALGCSRSRSTTRSGDETFRLNLMRIAGIKVEPSRYFVN